MKSKKKLKPTKMHQHIDENGNTFGAVHPLDAEHKNKRTQESHNRTIKK